MGHMRSVCSNGAVREGASRRTVLLFVPLSLLFPAPAPIFCSQARAMLQGAKKMTTEAMAVSKEEPVPFVVNFPSGFNPVSGKEGQEESHGGLEAQAYRSVDSRNILQHVLIASNKEMEFVGSTKPRESAVKSPCQFVLGVFRRKEKTMQLIPISGGKVRWKAMVMSLRGWSVSE